MTSKHQLKIVMTVVTMIIIMVGNMQAQSIKFTLQVDKDTVRVGDFVTVTYSLSGGQGDFIAPDFDSLHLVGGPNYSSSMSIINGKIDQQNTYSFIFQLVNAGEHAIPSATINIDGKPYESPSSSVFAIANPDWKPYNKKPAVPSRTEGQKKRKVTRI